MCIGLSCVFVYIFFPLSSPPSSLADLWPVAIGRAALRTKTGGRTLIFCSSPYDRTGHSFTHSSVDGCKLLFCICMLVFSNVCCLE